MVNGWLCGILGPYIKGIVFIATSYPNQTVSQIIGAGVPTASNSTVALTYPLSPGSAVTLNATAKDQYNNLVTGYVFKCDVTITNNDLTTAESYSIFNGTAITSTTTNISFYGTGSNGVASVYPKLPATIDVNDGVSFQVKLNNDITNVGSAFSYTRLGQTITFGSLSSATYGGSHITLTGTASSGLSISYASSNTAVATVSGSTVTIVGAGSTNITASQVGNSTYAAAYSRAR